MEEFSISNRLIGNNHPAFIVAELSGNHLKNYDLAVKTIESAKKAGADAIKVQTLTPDTLTINCNNEHFKINADSLWDGKTLYDLYSEVAMPWEWQPKLQKIALDLGLIFFSTPFDKSSVDFLEKLEIPAYKIASFEITDIPLLKYIATKRKPVILSTGIATLGDIKNAVKVLKKFGNAQFALLKCTSIYPSPLEELNLLTICDLKRRFKTIVGLSDHTLEMIIPIASIALGAKIIEKHLILDRKLGGADSNFSLEPDEFKEMVISIRNTEIALGKINYNLSEKLEKSRIFSRSIFVVEDVKKGEIFSETNIRSIRPGVGLHPKYYDKIIGKKAKKDIKKGTPLNWELIG